MVSFLLYIFLFLRCRWSFVNACSTLLVYDLLMSGRPQTMYQCIITGYSIPVIVNASDTLNML